MESIKIAGMSCDHCVKAVREALEGLGMTKVDVNLAAGTATFTPTTAFSEDQVREVIDDAGFDVEAVQ